MQRIGPVCDRSRLARSPWTLLVLATVMAGAGFVHGQTRQSFESARPALVQGQRDCQLEVHEHGLCLEQAYEGSGSETVRFTAGPGERVEFDLPLHPVHVIPELGADVWVRGNRPGVQLLLRVVLPRQQTRKGPMRVLLPGDSYRDPGQWRRLTLRDASSLLRGVVVNHRAEFHQTLDTRDAYAEAVVIDMHCGPGRTQVWVDGLSTQGEAPISPRRLAEMQARRGDQRRFAERIAVSGDQILIDDRPAFVRAVRLNGEPLALAHELGFNAVWLEGPPTRALAEAARDYRMWLIAPSSPEAMVAEFQVLAWRDASDLGPQLSRPRLAPADPDLADGLDVEGGLVVVDGSHWRIETPLAEQGQQWRSLLEARSRKTPALIITPTEFDAPDVSSDATSALSPDQIRLAAYQAVQSGARGVVFWSRRRLDAPSEQTRRDALRWVNAELSRWEPWLASGVVAPVEASQDPLDETVVIATPRSQLAITVRHAPDERFETGPDNKAPLGLTLPVAASSAPVFRLTQPPSRRQAVMTPLTSHRVAGGVRLNITDSRRIEVLLIGEDSLAVAYAGAQSARSVAQIVKLKRRLAAQAAGMTVEVNRRLEQLGRPLLGAEQLEQQANEAITRARRAEDQGDLARSDAFARRAADRLARLRLGHWRQAAAVARQTGATPYLDQYAWLPLHWKLVRSLINAHWRPWRAPDPWRSSGEFRTVSADDRGAWLQTPPIVLPPGAVLRVAGRMAGVSGTRRAGVEFLSDGKVAWLRSPDPDGRFHLLYAIPNDSPLVIRWTLEPADQVRLPEIDISWTPPPAALANSPGPTSTAIRVRPGSDR